MNTHDDLLNCNDDMCSLCGNDLSDMCSKEGHDTYRDHSKAPKDRYVKLLDFREGNEESSEETSGCKASVYAEFGDCPRAENFIEVLSFRHFERFFRFDQSDRKTYKKSISDGVNVSVVLNVVTGNTSKREL